jgi:hypothetical protein
MVGIAVKVAAITRIETVCCFGRTTLIVCIAKVIKEMKNLNNEPIF